MKALRFQGSNKLKPTSLRSLTNFRFSRKSSKTETYKNHKFLEVRFCNAKPKALSSPLISFLSMKNHKFNVDKVKAGIVNIALTSDLGVKLNLKKICSHLAHTEYNPEQFPGLVFKIKEPRSSALLFTSGKIVCTGTKSIEDAKKAVNNLIRALNKLKYGIEPNPVLKVQNIVASGQLGVVLNLNQIAMRLRNIEFGEVNWDTFL